MSCVAILRLQLPLCVDTGRDRRFNLLRILRHDVREVLPKEAKIAFGVHFESIQQGGDRVEREWIPHPCRCILFDGLFRHMKPFHSVSKLGGESLVVEAVGRRGAPAQKSP
eukprot:scaffold245_cov256-Pinguiococcus_pyrenoidosus.AAC.4